MSRVRHSESGIKALGSPGAKEGCHGHLAVGALLRASAAADLTADHQVSGAPFSGALAVALGEGRSMEESIRFGAAAGALAVTKRGVQTAMPTRQQVDDLYQRDGA